MNASDRRSAVYLLEKAQRDFDIRRPESAVERLETVIDMVEGDSS